MLSAIVIPSRYGSTRFPGKPLALIGGKSLLERTWRIACAVKNVDEIIIATDDERINNHATKFGAKVVLTSESCVNGTERVLEALKTANLKAEVVINLQGDAVLTPPWVIQSLVDTLKDNPQINLVTPATKLSSSQLAEMMEKKAKGEAGGTFVTFDKNKKALYFSKSQIPYLRNKDSDPPVYRHIGLYGYRLSALESYVKLPQSPLEKAEGLEQLRALENGMPIHVVVVDYRGRTHWSVDSPEDAQTAERLIQTEGELVPA